MALEKKPEEKTEEDLQKLIVPLIRTVMNNLLSSENEGKKNKTSEIYLTPVDLKLLALFLKFQFTPEGTDIITAGDYGDKLFIIIEGEARVLVPNKRSNDERQQVKKDPKEKQQFNIRKKELNAYFIRFRKQRQNGRNSAVLLNSNKS